MGFRSTFTTQDYAIKWPEWFRDKYAGFISFAVGGTGPIHPIREGKTYGAWENLHTDIQKAIDWNEHKVKFILVYLHECGGITRCQIEQDSIKWTEPDGWASTDGVTHEYCSGCSDA